MRKTFLAMLLCLAGHAAVCAQSNGTLNWRKSTSSTEKKKSSWVDDVIKKDEQKRKEAQKRKDAQKQKATTSSSTSSAAAPSSSKGKTMSGSDIFRKYGDAVFMILTKADDNIHQGSGFFINSSGLAVSNAHVFENADAVIAKKPGYDKFYKIDKVYYYDREADFILFHVDIPSSRYIPLAKSKPSVGDKVYAIGSPKGLENTFASGEVSQLRDQNLIQISIPIDHGSSGGALINEYGEVVGITTGGYSSSANLNFAVSIELIKTLLE